MVVRALSSTGESLVIHMKTGERSPELNSHINDIVSQMNAKWEELKEKAEVQWKVACERGEKFEVFVGKLTDFYNWLSEFYSTVYDEICERIPPKASDEIIAHHRNILKVGYLGGCEGVELERGRLRGCGVGEGGKIGRVWTFFRPQGMS